VTHPFHPLCGRRFEVADRRTAWGEDRVYVHGDAGELLRLPAAWTAFSEPDPFLVASAGRSVLHGDDLLRLVAWASAPAEDCKRKDAANVKEKTPGLGNGSNGRAD
jgi:hypothetical protein